MLLPIYRVVLPKTFKEPHICYFCDLKIRELQKSGPPPFPSTAQVKKYGLNGLVLPSIEVTDATRS